MMGRKNYTLRKLEYYRSLGDEELSRDIPAGNYLGDMLRLAAREGWIERA